MGELPSRLWMAVYLQVSDGEGLLKNVGSVSPSRQSCHGGQVATVATHSFDDKHPTLGASCRLLDAVTGLQRQWVAERPGQGSDSCHVCGPYHNPSLELSPPQATGAPIPHHVPAFRDGKHNYRAR